MWCPTNSNGRRAQQCPRSRGDASSSSTSHPGGPGDPQSSRALLRMWPETPRRSASAGGGRRSQCACCLRGHRHASGRTGTRAWRAAEHSARRGPRSTQLVAARACGDSPAGGRLPQAGSGGFCAAHRRNTRGPGRPQGLHPCCGQAGSRRADRPDRQCPFLQVPLEHFSHHGREADVQAAIAERSGPGSGLEVSP